MWVITYASVMRYIYDNASKTTGNCKHFVSLKRRPTVDLAKCESPSTVGNLKGGGEGEWSNRLSPIDSTEIAERIRN
jgi:hypothetical protein